ncbi:MAG: M20 family metallo-hydrolase, partial [Anaerolineae bacterium]
MSSLQPQRTIDELKELRTLTGNADGAQRVAFTDTWATARAWMKEKLAGLPVEYETDEAGNVWVTLRGKSDREMLIGGHLDSVPNGGWLDGCLNVVGGLEVLRRIASEGTPPVTVRLVDWADEEGARFGRSLFGSSACSGTMNPDDLRGLVDKQGIQLVDAIANFGVNLDTAKQSHKQLKNAAAYLE